MTKKDPVEKEIRHPADDRYSHEYIEWVHRSGRIEYVDLQGKPLNPLVIPDQQIKAWTEKPKEEGLKEALTLFQDNELTPAEIQAKLAVLRYMSDLTGATVPAGNGMNVIFYLPDNKREHKPKKIKAIDTVAKPV